VTKSSSLIGVVYALAAVAVIAVVSACNPILRAESPAPPGRSARLDEVTNRWGVIKSYRMELSQGVALAMTCYYGGPCEKMKVVSDDPNIADVRPASLGVLEHSGLAATATASAVVVVGKTPGSTKLHLTSKEGDREIVVTIIEPPLAMKTAAR
jgi:hypothetical protein